MKEIYSMRQQVAHFKYSNSIIANLSRLYTLLRPGIFCFIILIAASLQNTALAQDGNKFACNGNYYFTRQISPSTKISSVNIDAAGSVTVNNISSLLPNKSTNATVYYNGYIFTQDWAPSSFTLLRVKYDGSYDSKTVSGLPSGIDFNNAGVSRDGFMYILSTDASPILYKIDLGTWETSSGALSSTNVTCTMTAGSRIWGDIAFDPMTDTAYAWYHPSSNPASGEAPRGLYQIRNYKSSSPSIVKVGTEPANYTMGTLFFNERGQLFAYGVPSGGGDQKYLYYIDKETGEPTQLGDSETSSQSDGCECSYRLSLTLTAGDAGAVEIPNCSAPSGFKFDLVANNTESVSFDNIDFTFEIDPRFSFSKTEEEIRSVMEAKFGEDVDVIISDVGTGVNNKLYMSGLSIEMGSTPFEIDVKIASGGDEFTDGEEVYFQSYFGGLSEFYGEQEPSSDALEFFGKNESKVIFNKTSDLCSASVSGNVFNDPDAANVNNSTGIINLVPDGLYANLLDGDNKVVVSGPVSTDGTYMLPVTNLGNYKVKLSIGEQTAGTILTANFLPPVGWVYTGAYTGIENTGNTLDIAGISTLIDMTTFIPVNNVNFGINQIPETVVNIVTVEGGYPGGSPLEIPAIAFTAATIVSNPSTEDYSGGVVEIIRFTEFPSGIDSIDIKGIMYSNATWPLEGVEVMYDPANGVSNIFVYPSAGTSSVILPIASIDNGGAQDPTPGSITLNLGVPLPLQLISFDIKQSSDCKAILYWKTGNEDDAQFFSIEASNNGRDFEKVGEVLAKGDNNSYSYEDRYPIDDVNYYRLSMVYPQNYEYSEIKSITSACPRTMIAIQPNPATQVAYITGLSLGQQINILDITGRPITQKQVFAVSEQIDIEHFTTGIYQVLITDKTGRMVQRIKLVKK